MEYTILQLAKLSGVSTRTLRYYDGLGLLRPARLSPAGYRIYGEKQVARLQQILFYRELDVGLGEIGKILDSPGFDVRDALSRHRELLLEKRARLDALITNVEKTLACEKGETTMTDEEKFEGFKKGLLEENERKYGGEIREKYGEETVESSYRKFGSMTREEYGRFQALEQEFREALLAAFSTGDPAGEAAQHAADLHRQWLMFTWDAYRPEAHAGLARMYVDDPRFRAHYDSLQPGLAVFLRDAILVYTGKK